MKGLTLTRINIVKIVALSVAFIIFIRFVNVMLLGNSPTPPPIPLITRGNILDKNGKILAFQKKVPSLAGWATELKNEEESSKLLAPILGVKEDIILTHLTKKRDSSYFYIRRQISEEAAEKISILIDNDKLKGIRIERESGRSYPMGELTAHVTGYVGYDNIGLDGIEYTLDEILSPKQIKPSNKEEYGHNVYLTIDLNLQYFTAMAAKEVYEANFADSVSIISMDAKNGDILSYVSYPSYDPNNFNLYSDSERTNRITQTSYEPGSVYKIFSIASFLELGGITEETRYVCDGVYTDEKNNFNIKCLGVHGNIDTSGIIIHSCNDGTAQASTTVSAKDLYQILRDFGFGSKTGIAFNGESNGILRKYDRWSVRSKPTISIGQEISASAIQMITAATTLTNGGVLLKPHIVRKITTQLGVIKKEYTREPVREVISPAVARSMLHMMQENTERGTGRRTKIDGLNISTKTGTAQITNPETGKYFENKFLASALAIFPTEDPEVIMYVTIENPKGASIYGSQLAVPVIKKLAIDYINNLDINTETSPIHKVNITQPQPRNIEITINDIVPDLENLSKRDVIKILEKNGVKYKIEGSGYVALQNPLPGTILNEDTIIELTFK
ncbi:MAG: hypothetical protein B6229_02945 [Spirochaetaceae bacterium 4572_7]|nr:MAG: hypothetical protein B6229_02945 [Spirochaetaceae bacterium 4572_7]